MSTHEQVKLPPDSRGYRERLRTLRAELDVETDPRVRKLLKGAIASLTVALIDEAAA